TSARLRATPRSARRPSRRPRARSDRLQQPPGARPAPAEDGAPARPRVRERYLEPVARPRPAGVRPLDGQRAARVAQQLLDAELGGVAARDAVEVEVMQREAPAAV